jgi:phospholipid/cholesterol/gamma-HCH transport system substrate-binding protein
MDLYYKQELTVGTLVIAAVALMVAGLMWLTGRSFRTGDRVRVPVEFEAVGGLTAGDPVQISGVSVGRVADINLTEAGKVRVELEVNESVRPRADATAQVKSLDFLGAKYVAYSPGVATEPFPADSVIAGLEESEIASTAVALTESGTETLARLRAIMSAEMVEQVHATLAATERAMNVVARMGSGPLVSSADSALTAVRHAATALDTTLSNPSVNESLAQLDEIAEGVREMTEGLAAVTQNLAQMLALMQSPNGSVGRVLTDTTLYNDMHETLVALRRLLDDVREHPGRYINVKVF